MSAGDDVSVSLAGAAWLADSRLQAVLAALAVGGGEARIAGGAVRDALLGRPVSDIDIATSEPPERVVELAEAAGLHAVPTGIEHGTVTVVAREGAGEAKAFEVTTLRVDVETFGRHATVAFTADWAEDARRRDLTINALYCNSDGTIFDPLGVIDDIAARRVRFVGHAAERIAEDYLRILRFFRFHAELAHGPLDEEGLEAASKLRSGLAQLSNERVWGELSRLLAARGAVSVVAEIEKRSIGAEVLPGPRDLDAFRALAAIDAAHGFEPDPVLRLAALSLGGTETVAPLRARLRLSNEETERLREIAALAPAMYPGIGEEMLRALIYRHARAVRDAVLIAWARAKTPPDEPVRMAQLALATDWTPPVFALSGRDVRDAGVPEGEAVGEILAALEERWIASDFTVSTADLRAELKTLAKAALKQT